MNSREYITKQNGYNYELHIAHCTHYIKLYINIYIFEKHRSQNHLTDYYITST